MGTRTCHKITSYLYCLSLCTCNFYFDNKTNPYSNVFSYVQGPVVLVSFSKCGVTKSPLVLRPVVPASDDRWVGITLRRKLLSSEGNHKYSKNYPALGPETPRWKTANEPCEMRHGLFLIVVYEQVFICPVHRRTKKCLVADYTLSNL